MIEDNHSTLNSHPPEGSFPKRHPVFLSTVMLTAAISVWGAVVVSVHKVLKDRESIRLERQREAQIEAAIKVLEVKKIELQAKCRETKTIDARDLIDLFWQLEWIAFLRAEKGHGFLPSEAFLNQHATPFEASVTEKFQARKGKKDSREKLGSDLPVSVQELLDLKLSMDEQFGKDMMYQKDLNSIVDPLLKKRLQCQSGTRIFVMMALLQGLPTSPGDRLVEIYTEGHVQPGVLTADQTLYAIEMTVTGPGFKIYGPLKEVQTPLRVVLAGPGMIQSVLGLGEKQGTVVFDNVPLEKANSGWSLFAKSRGLKNPFGFGNADVPDGARRLLHRVSVGEVGGETYRAMESSGNALPKLLKILEQKGLWNDLDIIQNYCSHVPYYERCFYELNALLSPMMRDPGMPQAEWDRYYKALKQFIDQINEYSRMNNLKELNRDAYAIAKHYGIRFTICPATIMNQIINNELVLYEAREEALREKGSQRR